MEAPLEDYLATLPPGLPPLQRMLALEQRFFLADHNLLYTDKMSMAAGVEVRVPFLDNDLVRLANALPARFKQRGREGKWVLKKAMEPYLPREVFYRPKTGFGAPLRQWLRHELKELVDDTLSACHAAEARPVRPCRRRQAGCRRPRRTRGCRLHDPRTDVHRDLVPTLSGPGASWIGHARARPNRLCGRLT